MVKVVFRLNQSFRVFHFDEGVFWSYNSMLADSIGRVDSDTLSGLVCLNLNLEYEGLMRARSISHFSA